MKKISFLAVLVFSIILLQGCGATTTPTENVNPCNNDNVKIGVLTDTGGLNDKSFNQGTWEGIQEYCTESSIGATTLESKQETDYIPNLTTLTNTDGIEVVVAIGETLQNPVYEVAKDNPDTKYILIDGQPTDANEEIQPLDNVSSFLFNEQESGYLVGYIAGTMTETNKVGFVGGMEITPVQKFGWGFVQGVNAANPDCEVQYQYSGSFSDTSKGQQIAESMYGSGVDIIFSAAGGVNDGVLNSAKTRVKGGEKVWVIGVDRDMYEDGLYADEHSVILTSAVKKVGAAAKQGLEEVFNDEFKSGATTLGYKEDGVGLPEENPNITDETIITDAKASLEATDVADNLADTQKIVTDMNISGDL
ncbi:MAG: BMP family protein [Mycoplasmatales bacterium]